MTSEDRDPAIVGPEQGDEPTSGSRSSRSRKHLPIWQEAILLGGVALVLAIIIKAFFAQAFYIPSESMEPGLVTNDRIMVQKVSYWFGGSPSRGDVVVFKDPGGWLPPGASGPDGVVTSVLAKIGLYPTDGHLVKRVIGVAGDTIECCDDQGRLLVNGVPLDEDDYVQDDPSAECRGPMSGTCDWTAGPIPEGNVFVMGDNRKHSADSSFHMCRDDETECVPGSELVDTDLVVGKVFVLAWPWKHFDWITRPDTFEDVPDAS